MGNHEALPSNIETLKTQSWVQAGEDQQNALFSNVNPYRRRLLANIITHQLIQQYEINFITEQDYNSYIAELSYRQVKQSSRGNNQSQDFIYPIRYFVNKSKHEMCTTIHTGYLYADKVDLRLKEINDIPFQDLLYMYKATLTGFKTLYEKVGYFDIVEEMIFITRTGQVNVWMNANLAKNYPNYQKTNYTANNLPTQHTYSKKQPQNLYGSQAEMIRKLILLIEKNSDEYSDMEQPQNQLFSQFLQNKNIFDKLSFQHSLDEYQNYLCQNNLHCSQYMKSIPQLFSPDQLFQNNPTNYQQSHVNQITTQHLTQMKKKFQPMQTIVQNQKYQSHIHGQNRPKPHIKLHESQVVCTPHLMSNPREQQIHGYENNSKKVVRPGQTPFTDMGQSRYSQQNNKHPHEYDPLRQSSSSNNVAPQQIPKPNSVSALNYRNNIPIGFSNYSEGYHQPYTHQIPQNVFYQQSFSNGSGFVPPQYLQQNDFHQRVFMNHSPSNFSGIPGMNNGIQSQKVLPLNQVNFFSSFSQPQNIGNQQFNKINNSPLRNQNQHQAIKTPSNNNVAELTNSSNKNTIPLIKQSVQKKSSLNEGKKSQIYGEQKGKIKYFTTKDSYQLDEQIANDLEKFLGLKVN